MNSKDLGVDPWRKFVDLTSTFKGVDYAWRYGTIPITVRENVSTHLFWVTHYAALLHLRVDPTDHETLGVCLMGASLHDIGESLTGEVVRTFKYTTPELKQEIDRAENIMLDRLPDEAKELFIVYDDMLTKLGTGGAEYVRVVLKVADFVAVFQFMKRELERGNREIGPYYDRMISDLKMMRDGAALVTSPHGILFHPGVVYGAMEDAARELVGKYR